MEKLNCNIGDLAMVVKCSLPVNQGTIVHIQSAKGEMKWHNSKDPLFTWNVVVMTAGKKLIYENGEKTEALGFGPVADYMLVPITPSKKTRANKSQLKLELEQ